MECVGVGVQASGANLVSKSRINPGEFGQFNFEVRMAPGRSSISSKASKQDKAGSSCDSSISQRLDEISAKLSKLDELEKLNKDLLKSVLKLQNRIDVLATENRLLKQEVEDLKQAGLQDELLIKGVKLDSPQQCLDVWRKVSEGIGFDGSKAVKDVRPLIFQKNEHTDAVLVKFWSVEGKGRFIKSVRNLKKPLTPRDLNIKSKNKVLIFQDHLTKEKQRIHKQTGDLCKLGLQRPWIYRGSTWVIHPETKKRCCIKDSADVEKLEFVLVTAQQDSATATPEVDKVTALE